tara:strand:- start:329 stop:793 length:465 start_codon:yes stop_codon:yes gene_type:complete
MKVEWVEIFFKFFTTWNLVLGILLSIFKMSPAFNAAIISNILTCSILGTILMTKYGKKFGMYYSKTYEQIQIIDFFLHYILPLFIVTTLLYRLPKYNLYISMVYILTLIAIYGMVINPYKQYGNISELSYFFVGFPIISLFINIFIFSIRRYVL